MALSIPTVTQEDLFAFHQLAFGAPFQPLVTIAGVKDEADHDDEDDGLGYYSDGVKRTLTDAEIAIFRHSEIHALRRRLELEREAEIADAVERAAADATSEQDTRSEGEVSDDESSAGVSTLKEALPRSKEIASGDKGDAQFGDEDSDEDDDETAYAEFLRQERREFEQTAQRQRQKQKAELEQFDRTISTRRRVRELDEMGSQDAVLDYGEEGGTGLDYGGQPKQEPAVFDVKETSPPIGRKIWWPQLGVKVKFFDDG